MNCSEVHSANSHPAAGGMDPLGGSGSESSSLDRSETTSHLGSSETRSSRWFHRGQARERRAVLEAFADSDDDTLIHRHDRIRRCCCSAMLYQLPSGRIVPIPTRCRDRLCMTCSVMRSKTMTLRTGEACRRMDSIRLITLTAPAIDAPLGVQLRQLRKALAAFRRTRDWKHHVRGGFYVFEVTLNPSTGLWHPHVHVLADGSFWRQAAIRDGWRYSIRHNTTAWSIADDDHVIVDVRKVHDGRDAARYMAKYVSKSAAIHLWEPSKICEYALAVVGMRALATFGSLHNVTLDPSDPNEAPECSTPLVPMGVLAEAAALGDGEAVFALRALLVYKPDLRNLVAWDPPPIAVVDDLNIIDRLRLIARWCSSVWSRWPVTDRRCPRVESHLEVVETLSPLR